MDMGRSNRYDIDMTYDVAPKGPGWEGRVALEIPINVRKGKIGWTVNEDVPQMTPRDLRLMV